MQGKFIFAIALSAALGGCAGFWGDLSGNPPRDGRLSVSIQELPAFPRQCLNGDRETPDLAQCSSMESATCYQLDTGAWCSGPGTQLCPLNPELMPLQGDCPPGVDCWIYSPNLRCRSV